MELVERIGSGRYGEGLALPNALGALRAVKIVRRAEFDDDRPYERELNGIRKFEPISRTHEGFINILPVGRTEEYFYYVMELANDCSSPGKIWGLGRAAVQIRARSFWKEGTKRVAPVNHLLSTLLSVPRLRQESMYWPLGVSAKTSANELK